jgi:hypothetical protein
MRIEVIGEDLISPQARTYAEYRLLAALTQFSRLEHAGLAGVALRQVERKPRPRVVCSVTVASSGWRSLRIRTTGEHAYAAINRGVERFRNATAAETLDDRVS